ncbi:MAG: cytochrome c [Myxococcota bacterium]
MKTLIVSAVFALGVIGCTQTPVPDREWTAADHAHPPDNLVDPTRVPQQERPDLTVGELLWQGRCAGCHGPDGQGGGQAPISFASADWQANISNATIARTIAAGMPPGMPAFADLLSAEQIEALVVRIRRFSER